MDAEVTGTKSDLIQNGIAVLDFGGQYSHLICRRVRAMGVYAALLPHDTALEELKSLKVAGIIMSGGPASVYDSQAPKPDSQVLQGPLPVLGICYGLQLLVQNHGGEVKRAQQREYGKATLNIRDHSGIFSGIAEDSITCWMSHGDSAMRLPEDFNVIAVSENSPYAAISSKNGRYYGVQFHPEVIHTQRGERILSNFVIDICHAKKNWSMESFVEETTRELSGKLQRRTLCAVSGGVDSSTTAVLLHGAIGDKLKCVFVDHGLLREGEAEQAVGLFKELGISVTFIDASARFLAELKGVRDPEEKRKIIGRVFGRIFEDFARKNGPFGYLAQGTLYPDVIESGRTSAPASIIKTHHNVGGLPKDLSLEVVEPLRELYKDEARQVGRMLGLPKWVVERHPFPGPGLAVRIVGEVTEDKLRVCRTSNRIVEDVISEHGLYDKVWEAFAYVGDDKVTGVLGDERKLGYQVTVKVVESLDAMTADWSRVPFNVLEEISGRITNEVEGVVSVVYSISTKPPATIEPQ